MNFILFQFILLISRLPLNFIYKITDGLIFIVFHVFGYRKKVIRNNITNAFPEKSAKEIDQIIKGFEGKFSSLIAELIKLFTLSEKEHTERMKFNETEGFIKQINHKNTIFLCGHVMNWEMATICPVIFDTSFSAVYMKLQNKFWDKKLYAVRSKHNIIPIEMKETVDIIKNTPNDGKNVFLVIGDQSPHISKAKYSLEFMGRETPIFVGYDFLAAKKDLAVFYAEITCTKRGFYECRSIPILPKNGTKFGELEISSSFFKLLEETIKKDPTNYLWTHKRWKYKKGVDY